MHLRTGVLQIHYIKYVMISSISLILFSANVVSSAISRKQLPEFIECAGILIH